MLVAQNGVAQRLLEQTLDELGAISLGELSYYATTHAGQLLLLYECPSVDRSVFDQCLEHMILSEVRTHVDALPRHLPPEASH